MKIDNKVNERKNEEQAIAIDAIMKGLKKANQAMVVSATGTGKTEIAHKLIKTKLKGRTLILCHRKELVTDHLARAQKYGLDVGVFTADVQNTTNQVIVASIPKLLTRNTLKKSFNKNSFSNVIVDECHHAAAAGWTKVIKYFTTANLIGLTATPNRPDGDDISEFFGLPVYELTYNEAKLKGLIAKDIARCVLTNSSISGAVIKGEHYSAAQLDKLFLSQDRNAIIMTSYKKYGRTEVKKLGLVPKAICFCINVQHAKFMTKLFNSSGIKSDFLVGDATEVSGEMRKTIFDKFKNTNDLEMLCVVDLFNEGVDIPTVNCLLMARPTRSNITYQQQIGRGSRLMSNKQFFVMLDYVDNTSSGLEPYILSSLTGRSYPKGSIISDFLVDNDVLVKNSRVENVMFHVERFNAAAKEAIKASYTEEFLKLDSKTKISKARVALARKALKAS